MYFAVFKVLSKFHVVDLAVLTPKLQVRPFGKLFRIGDFNENPLVLSRNPPKSGPCTSEDVLSFLDRIIPQDGAVDGNIFVTGISVASGLCSCRGGKP